MEILLLLLGAGYVLSRIRPGKPKPHGFIPPPKTIWERIAKYSANPIPKTPAKLKVPGAAQAHVPDELHCSHPKRVGGFPPGPERPRRPVSFFSRHWFRTRHGWEAQRQTKIGGPLLRPSISQNTLDQLETRIAQTADPEWLARFRRARFYVNAQLCGVREKKVPESFSKEVGMFGTHLSPFVIRQMAGQRRFRDSSDAKPFGEVPHTPHRLSGTDLQTLLHPYGWRGTGTLPGSQR